MTTYGICPACKQATKDMMPSGLHCLNCYRLMLLEDAHYPNGTINAQAHNDYVSAWSETIRRIAERANA
jgi:hypothetical protein